MALRCLLLVSMRMVHNCRTLSCCADSDIMRNHQGRSIDTMPRLSGPVARVPKPNYKMNISRYLLLTLMLKQSMTLENAEVLTLKTLKQVMEEKLDSKNVQLASVTKEKGFHIYNDDEMAAVVARL